MEHELGRKNPHLKSIFVKSILKGKDVATKVNYAGLFTKFLLFCERQDRSPIDQLNPDSLDPWSVMYWFADQTYQLGSCNSISSWKGALTFLCRHLNLPTIPDPLRVRAPDGTEKVFSDLAQR